LKRRSGGTLPSTARKPSTSITLPLSSPSIVIDVERPTEFTPGTCASRSVMLWCVRAACGASLMNAGDMAMANV
jgi:hypothetical protein